MTKILAAILLIWLFQTVYFTFKAIKGSYPIYYGIATSTAVTIFGSATGYLVVLISA